MLYSRSLSLSLSLSESAMAENPSFPPVEEEEAIRDVGEEKQDEEEDELEDEEGGVSGLSEVLADEPTSGAVAESRETLLETLKVELAEKNRCAGLQATTALDSQGQAELKEVVVSYDFDPETSPTVTVPVTETQLHDRTSPGLPSSQLSTNSISKCISSAASPTVQGQSLSAEIVNSPSVPETKPQNSLKLVNSTVTSVVKRPISDGYNWRKYGQKQVKRPKGFRSYFKCTHYSCQAKKLEVSDDTGHIVEIVTRGLHDHDPPGKDDRIRTSRAVASPLPLSLNTGTNQASKPMNDSDPSTSSKECVQEAALPQERKRLCPSSPDGGRETPVKEEVSSEAVVKGRAKKNDVSCSDSAFKPGKKPKFVVHAAGDVGISADGYRWRKYGQKMVKGNPNPRNYYRCTSAGCPVRKHIETAVDNTNAVIIAYKGVHDHDMPVPKKRHGPPSAPLVAAAAAAAGMNNLQAKKSEAGQSQVTSTQWTFGTEGELTGEARELGGEKAIESARTLLSIGFEIKPC